jgi:hypothetical protein
MLLWWGVFLVSLFVANFDTVGWLGIASPLFTMLILLFLSGLPTTEPSQNKKFHTNAEFQRYKKRTSIVIPFPPFLYGLFPGIVKAIFFFEYPFYDYKPGPEGDKPKAAETTEVSSLTAADGVGPDNV